MTGDPLVRLRRDYGYSMKTIAMNLNGLMKEAIVNPNGRIVAETEEWMTGEQILSAARAFAIKELEKLESEET